MTQGRKNSKSVWNTCDLAKQFNVTNRSLNIAIKQKLFDNTYTGDEEADITRMRPFMQTLSAPQNSSIKGKTWTCVCCICNAKFQGRAAHAKACDKCKKDDGFKYFPKYGISQDDFNKILASQNGRCKLCDRDFSTFKKAKDGRSTAHVDHDHETGEIRGIVCNACNVFVGFLDRPGNLERAIEYLKSKTFKPYWLRNP